MATYRVPILGWATVPDTTGYCWAEPLDVAGTNNVWKHLVWRLSSAASTAIGIRGQFTVPRNYVGNAKLVIYWTSTATSGNVLWQLYARVVAGDNAASIDQLGVTEAPFVVDTAPTSSLLRMVATINLTSASYSADATVQFELDRLRGNASDTMAGDALMLAAFFEYTDI